MSESAANVLIVNRRRLELVDRMKNDSGLRLSLITEPGCVGLYPSISSVELVSDVQNLDEVRQATLNLMERVGAFDAVVAPAESSMPTGGYIRSYLGLPGLTFDVAHSFCNKSAMKAKLRRAGIAVAGSALAPTAASIEPTLRAHGLPAIVKPAWGDGSANVHVVRTEADVSAVAGREGALLSSSAYSTPPFLIEDLIDVAVEYHCDGLVRDGHVEFVSASQYLLPSLESLGSIFGSYTLPHDSALAMELAELHAKVVGVMKLRDSVTHLEVFRTRSGDLVVGEIACRPGGSGIPKNLLRAYEFDTWDHFAATELNRRHSWQPRNPSGTHIWVMFPVRLGLVTEVSGPDVFSDLEAVEEMQIKVRPGDRLEEPLYVSSQSAVVHCRLPSTDGVPSLVEELGKRFQVSYA